MSKRRKTNGPVVFGTNEQKSTTKRGRQTMNSGKPLHNGPILTHISADNMNAQIGQLLYAWGKIPHDLEIADIQIGAKTNDVYPLIVTTAKESRVELKESTV